MQVDLRVRMRSSLESGTLRSVLIGRSVTAVPAGGAAWRNLQNLRALATFGPVAAFSLTRSTDPGGQVAPREAAECEHLDLAEFGPGRWARWRWLVQRSGTPLGSRWFDARAARRWSAEITSWRPQLVVCEELWTFRWLQALGSGPWATVLDEHNLEARLRRQIEERRPFVWSAKGLRVALRQGMVTRRVRLAERRAVRSVDQVWVCSGIDAGGLRDEYGPVSDVQVVPNTVDLDYYAPVREGQVTPAAALAGVNPARTLLFVGAGGYEPNRTAALWLIRDLFPELLRRFGDARLLIVGGDPRETLSQAAATSRRVIVTGRVDDVRPYLAGASLVVVPLLEGSGTRLKLCEAFASKLPVVCTPKAAEGLEVEAGEHVRLASTVPETVRAIADLWSDREGAERMAERAFELARARYGLSATRDAVARALSRLVEAS